jgi:hypothetical protein
MRSATVGFLRRSPDLIELVTLLRLSVLLLDVLVPRCESEGDVFTLPKLGLGLADESRLEDS